MGLSLHMSIVIPVHNEARNIAGLCREICEAIGERHPYEIIVVDDGSTDGTPAVLADLQERCSILRVIRHRQRCGQSSALSTGVRLAENDLIVTIDGDGQNDPRDIERLLASYRDLGAGKSPLIVTGYRRHRHDSRWRKLSSRVANAVRDWLLKDNTPDAGCGLKVLPRDLFLRMPHFDHMHRFLPTLAKQAGASVVSVETRHRPRKHGTSHYGTLDRLGPGIVDLIGVMWLWRRTINPQIERMSTRHEQ